MHDVLQATGFMSSIHTNAKERACFLRPCRDQQVFQIVDGCVRLACAFLAVWGGDWSMEFEEGTTRAASHRIFTQRLLSTAKNHHHQRTLQPLDSSHSANCAEAMNRKARSFRALSPAKALERETGLVFTTLISDRHQPCGLYRQ